MITKLLNSKAFFISISVIFAVFLFLNANSASARNKGFVQTGAGGQVYTTTLENIPISIQYDDTKYFISNYTSTATVTLSSSNQVEILQQKSTDLRSFKLMADLTGLKSGEHTVPIIVKNLSPSMNAKTSPSSLSVSIEKRKDGVFAVDAIVDKSLIPEGYTLTDVSTTPSKVIITAGTDSIKNIHIVQAVLPFDTNLSKKTSISVNLEAVNSSGELVPATFSQASVKMTLKLTKSN